MSVIEFGRSPQPRASIVVVAMRHAHFLEGCLAALSIATRVDVASEVIVVLNGADSDVRAFVDRDVRGAMVLRSDVNLGFAGANNLAARSSTGEFIVLLNDDTEVESTWLEALVRTADAYPDAGAVGSRILFPDGSLQEAGAIIWSDGSTVGVGRGEPRDTPLYQAVRQVDYCSGCSLLVRRDTWEAVGGLDETFFPAYCEDADLAMAIHARRQTVLYAPHSRVVHYESQSSEPDFKRFLVLRNRGRFRLKWASRLAWHEHRDPSSPASLERAIRRAQGVPRRILVLDDRMPDASLGSGFGRMRDLLLELASHYAVTFYPVHEAAPLDRELAERGIEILRGPLDQELSRASALYDAIIVSRPNNFQALAPTIRRLQPQAMLIYDAEAVFHLRLRRQQMLARASDDSRVLEQEASEMAAIEATIAAEADLIVCISRSEAAFFECLTERPVHVISPAFPAVSITPQTFDERADMVFVSGWLGGNASPNADGFLWFADRVLPRIRECLPSARVIVTGGDPPDSVKSLASQSVVLVGCRPDLREVYGHAAVAIAPIRYGAGVKIKAMEALRYGVPLVATTEAMSGIEWVAPTAVRVSDDAETFADAIVELLVDRAQWHSARVGCETTIARWSAQPRDGWSAILSRALAAPSPEDVGSRVRRALEPRPGSAARATDAILEQRSIDDVELR